MNANTMTRRCTAALAATVGLVTALCAVTLTVPAALADTSYTNMYRLYNPNSGEHFYTAAADESVSLQYEGWTYEGIGWTAPANSNTPVYRLYNANAGDHHYTMDESEKSSLADAGWSFEGIGWYSDDAEGVPLYRQYNPNATSGSHNYTSSIEENEALVEAGWNAEGIGWYGCAVENGERTWVEATGHWETVTISEAWDEPVYETVEGFSCGNCGAFFPGDPIESSHDLANHQKTEHPNEFQTSGVVWRNIQVDTIHHDAVTETKWVEDSPGHWA